MVDRRRRATAAAHEDQMPTEREREERRGAWRSEDVARRSTGRRELWATSHRLLHNASCDGRGLVRLLEGNLFITLRERLAWEGPVADHEHLLEGGDRPRLGGDLHVRPEENPTERD